MFPDQVLLFASLLSSFFSFSSKKAFDKHCSRSNSQNSNAKLTSFRVSAETAFGLFV